MTSNNQMLSDQQFVRTKMSDRFNQSDHTMSEQKDKDVTISSD